MPIVAVVSGWCNKISVSVMYTFIFTLIYFKQVKPT
jgi:hypothetical protein